jgi:hypothetical protein
VRFNSLNCGILLNGPVNVSPSRGSVSAALTLQSSEPPKEVLYCRAGSPTAGGLLAVPPGKTNQSRRSSEGRRQTPLSSILPSQQPGTPPKRHSYPIVTIEEATSDGYGDDEVIQEEPQWGQQPVSTPVKKARLHPLSE